MTSNKYIYPQEQYNRQDRNDDNTADDTLLLMGEDAEDSRPLLSNNDHIEENRQFNASNGLSSPSHCHVPDDKFDYGARNRLIIVLLICILFMIIEIVGMFAIKR